MGKLTRSGYFVGEFEYRLDDKYRLALPKRLRIEIEGFEVVLTKGFEPCIAGYDLSRWQAMAAQPLSLPVYEEKGRALRRTLFASAAILELDAQGRVILPESLVKWSGLTGKIGKEVTIIGAGDHFEIWEKDNWQKYGISHTGLS